MSDLITELLIEWNSGSADALAKLLPLVERDLRRIAANHMRRERPGHTLQTTALVNEAYLKLINQREVHWQNRAHVGGEMESRCIGIWLRARPDPGFGL